MTRTEVLQIMDTMRVSGVMVYSNAKLTVYRVGTKEAAFLRTSFGTDFPLWMAWGDTAYVVNLSAIKAPLKRRLYLMYNRPDRLYKIQRIGKDVTKQHYGERDYDRFIKSDYRI